MGFEQLTTTQLLVQIKADVKELQRGMNQAAKSTRQTQQQMSGFGKGLDALKKTALTFGLAMGAAGAARAVMRFGKESIEAARQTQNFRNALQATLPPGSDYNEFIERARKETRGMMAEWEIASAATSLFAGGLANTTDEAAQLIAAGQALVPVFAANGASMEKFTRLLASGNRVLLDNFGLTQEMVNAEKAQIEATTNLSGEEAKLAAVKKVLIAQAEKFKTAAGESTTASYGLRAAMTDLKAEVGEGLTPAVGQAEMALTGLIRKMLEARKAARSQDYDIAMSAKTYEEYVKAAFNMGDGVQFTREQFHVAKAAANDYTKEMIMLGQVQPGVTEGIQDTGEALDDSAGEWQKAGAHQHDYWTAMNEYGQDYLDQQADILETEGKLADARAEMGRAMLSNQANYYLSLRDYQDQSIQDEASYIADAASMHQSAAASKADAEQALSERLAEIEKERQDKIAWVRTGSWARTAEEEAEAEAYHNQIYDEMKQAAINKTNEKVDGILAAESKKESALAQAREREVAEQAAALEEMKLNAALSLMEQAGLLEQFTGGMATTAADAAALIKSGLLPVTGEMGLAIQSALGEMTSGQEEAAATAEASADVLSQAFAGTISEDVIPGLQEMQEQGLTSLEATRAKIADEVIPVLGEDGGLASIYRSIAEENIPTVATAHEESMATVITGLQNVMNEATTTMNSYQADFQAGKMSVDNMNSSLDTTYDSLGDLVEQTKKLRHELSRALSIAQELARINNGGGGGGGDGGGESEFQSGTHGWQRVPPGYPNDRYRVGLTSGEMYNVIPANEARMGRMGTAGNTYNYYLTIQSSAPTENVQADFALMELMAGAGA